MGGVGARIGGGLSYLARKREWREGEQADRTRRRSRIIFMRTLYQNDTRRLVHRRWIHTLAIDQSGYNAALMQSGYLNQSGLIIYAYDLFSAVRFHGLLILRFFIVSCQNFEPGLRNVGIFEDHSDVGTVLHPGSVDYDAAKKTYTHSAAAARTCGRSPTHFSLSGRRFRAM